MAEDLWTEVYSGVEPQAQVTPWSSSARIVCGRGGWGGGGGGAMNTLQGIGWEQNRRSGSETMRQQIASYFCQGQAWMRTTVAALSAHWPRAS